jgi:hypothetical protein
MTNIYVFWKTANDPPSPWTRLTRRGRYVRFTDSFANHLSQVGAATHNHGNTMGSYNCGSGNELSYGSEYSTAMPAHSHTNPSWTISSNNNDPPYYGLDIIYMDLATWEAEECRFPEGAVILSSQGLSESEYLARFTAADGKFILNTTPGVTGGNTNTQRHRCQGTTGSYGSGTYWVGGGYDQCARCPNGHAHAVDLYSDYKYQGPRQLVTRLYEALAQTLNAQAGTVVFCDGTPSSNWEILTGWKDANLMPGNSDPTLSGADSHTQAISGNSSSVTLDSTHASDAPFNVVVQLIHSHAISATLSAASHVPLSVLLVPIKLKATLTPPEPPASHASNANAQFIGLTW